MLIAGSAAARPPRKSCSAAFNAAPAAQLLKFTEVFNANDRATAPSALP